MNAIDALDQRILDVLLTDSRISLKQLAEQVGLSSPSVSERLRRPVEDPGDENEARRLDDDGHRGAQDAGGAGDARLDHGRRPDGVQETEVGKG